MSRARSGSLYCSTGSGSNFRQWFQLRDFGCNGRYQVSRKTVDHLCLVYTVNALPTLTPVLSVLTGKTIGKHGTVERLASVAYVVREQACRAHIVRDVFLLYGRHHCVVKLPDPEWKQAAPGRRTRWITALVVKRLPEPNGYICGWIG